MGYRAIVSSSAFYYLDCGLGDFLGNDSSYDKMGDEGNGCDDFGQGQQPLQRQMWSGNRDETGMKRYAEVIDRLDEWRYRMVARGVGAEPIQPLWCLKNPWMCNLNQ
ncbi:hypothetical protein AMTR_s00088p00103700 [Amborella trichopoda]|uniref:Uncharacterized protein n=1 Tax=Amborella trichopoda TaxID=13333 RepID=W1NW42_AMBTC|nr:hypothetical protein AMTR_s00088p00103700 [Amborella trichopoda]